MRARGPYVTRGLEDVLLIVCFKSRPPMRAMMTHVYECVELPRPYF